MANARATYSANIDTAMATVTSNLVSYLNNGGNAGLFMRYALNQIGNTDPRMARYISRRWGASALDSRVPVTLAAYDVKP